MPDVKWEVCLSHKMEGTVGKSHLCLLSPRFGASTILNNNEKTVISPMCIVAARKFCFNRVLMQKYRCDLLRRPWSVFKLVGGVCRLWGSSFT